MAAKGRKADGTLKRGYRLTHGGRVVKSKKHHDHPRKKTRRKKAKHVRRGGKLYKLVAVHGRHRGCVVQKRRVKHRKGKKGHAAHGLRKNGHLKKGYRFARGGRVVKAKHRR